MNKTFLFWCPFIGNVGTAKAVLESAKSFQIQMNTNAKFLTLLVNSMSITQSLKKSY